MAAQVASSLADWSTNEANNEPLGSRTVGPDTDDNMRMIQAVLRNLASRTTLASAATCNLGSVEPAFLTVTGTTGITSFGTVSDGIWRVVVFGGALTLTYNATSMILPGAANITTAAGDVGWFISLGSGNWRCLGYMRANGQPVVSLSNLPDGTVGAPSLFFTSDTDTGMYRIGTNAGGLTANGTKRLEWNANGVFVTGEFEAGPSGANIDVSSAGAVTIAPSQNAGFTVSVPAASNGNNAGSVSLTAGQGAATTSNPGSVSVTAGAATSGSASGGSVNITAGNVPGGNNSVGGGDVILTGGSNGRSGAAVHGDILLRPGSGDSSTHNGLVKVQANGSTLVAQVSTVTHALTFGTAKTPNISSGGGSGATIAGNPNAFKVTLGTGPSTTLVITFDEDWTNAPIVIPRYQSADINVRASSISTTSVTFTFASSPASGGVLDVACFGYE